VSNTPKRRRQNQRLIDRVTLLDKVPLSYATVWNLMRKGEFPRSKFVGDRTFWLEHEVDAWIEAMPNRPLKGDAA
jgi:predicted DNA-binding transcriptional regulator AlpA